MTWGKQYGCDWWITDKGERVRWFRKRQAVRFYTAAGKQVGPEQRNVAPAMCFALHYGWRIIAVDPEELSPDMIDHCRDHLGHNVVAWGNGGRTCLTCPEVA